MNRWMNKILIVVLLTFLVPGGSMPALSSTPSQAEAQPTAPDALTDMPGWPMPAKPIPHHEPGKASKAASYTTQVKRANAEGLLETVQIAGLDAITADGGDPFSGNYTFVEKDQLLRSAFANNSFGMNTLAISTTITDLPGSQRYFGNYPANDIAAGDLNGDGVAEQIAAWMGDQNHIILATGEMPGMPGKTTSAPAAVSGSAPLAGYALDFDGVDDGVEVAPGINLANASFTVAFWAKRSSIDTADIVVTQGTATTNQWLHIGFRANNKFTCAFYYNDLDTPVYTDTGWHHWACTYNATTNLRSIYRDGVLVAQDTAAADYQGSGTLYIGKRAPNESLFPGTIDEVGIWNEARTPGQIEEDPFLSIPDGANLLAYWHFDEGSGTTALDTSGNNHDGALYGPLWTSEDRPQEDIHLLVRGYDASVWHCFYDVETSRCLSWNNAAGGTWLSAPAAASLGADQFDAFAIGADNEAYRRHWASGWSAGWQPVGDWPFPAPAWSLPLPELTAPAAVARGGAIDLFRLGPTNTLYWYNGSSWQDMGGMLASEPGAVSLSASHMQVFARGMDDALWTLAYNGGWGSWQRLDLGGMPAGVAIASAPAVVSPASGQMAVYVRGSDNQLWSALYNGSSWGSWTAGGGELASAPGASVASGATYLFAQTADDLLQTSEPGLAWQELGGLSACCTLQDTGIIPFRVKWYDYLDYSLDIETGYFWGDGRSQVVLGHYSASNEYLVTLYDISDNRDARGFSLEPAAQLTIPHQVGWARLITGDFLDGDGQDDIVLVSTLDASYTVEILRFSRETRALSVVENYTAPITAGSYFEGTLALAGGDFDADGHDELAVTTVWFEYVEFDPEPILCGVKPFWKYHAFTRLYDVDKSPDYNLVSSQIEIEYSVNVVRDLGSVYNIGLALAAGDLNGDGKDELIRTWPDHFETGWFNCDFTGINKYEAAIAYQFNRSIQVITLPENADPDHNTWPDDFDDSVITQVTVKGYTQQSYTDRLASGDFDRDAVREFVWQAADDAPGQTLFAYKFNPISQVYEQFGTKAVGWGIYPHLVTGAFTGESIRVGPPTHRFQERMTTPVALVNLPPHHQDIIKDGSGIRVIDLFDSAYATYQDVSSTGETFSATSKREWELSTGFELEAGAAGASVKTSLDNTYGENFSDSTTAIQELEVDATYTADQDDKVIFNRTDYHVWEYPVIGAEADNPAEAQTISVIWPVVESNNQTNLPTDRIGTLCDESFYAPSHQVNNAWSYAHTALNGSAFEDLGEKITSGSTTGGLTVNLTMSQNNEVTRESSFHNQISAGLELSYEEELEVPLIGKAFDFSFQAKADGSYSHESLSTYTSKVTDSTGVGVYWPSNPASPRVDIYMYWAKAGYMVVDYLTLPDTLREPWSFYTLTDPAFTLPWYGFPDPNNPVAPTCGAAKKLFTHDIEIRPAYAQIGDSVTITATVRNFSNEPPPADVQVKFYLDEPANSSLIASCSISKADLARIEGPAACTGTWTVDGASGEEKIFAMIDPGQAFDEMHDEDDLINNNVGYGLLYVANADYFDPGLRRSQAYQPVLYEEAPGSGYALFVPTTNITKTVRYELVPIDLGRLTIVGIPIQVLAYQGGEQEPEANHEFGPTPAGFEITYLDSGLLPGMQESNLKLYRLDGTSWVEAACPGLPFYRFLDNNAIAVPICQTGTFALSDNPPELLQTNLFLPMITR